MWEGPVANPNFICLDSFKDDFFSWNWLQFSSKLAMFSVGIDLQWLQWEKRLKCTRVIFFFNYYTKMTQYLNWKFNDWVAHWYSYSLCVADLKKGVSDGVDFDFELASIDLNECSLLSSSGGKHGLERRWICQPKWSGKLWIKVEGWCRRIRSER